METPNTRSKNKTVQKDGNNTATIARNHRPPSYTNSIQKFVVKYLVCGCAVDKMGTLTIPDAVPSPNQDAQTLKKAFKGWGTDEKAIIGVMGHRNATQRKEIREAYQQLYSKSLIDALVSELSGDFGKAVVLWSYDPAERDARLAKEALNSKRKGVKQLQVIVEIACGCSPNHLMAVRKACCALFDCSLEEDITSNAPLPLRKILVGLVSSYRYDGQAVDHSLAELEATKLQDLITKNRLENEELQLILATRSFFQLKATFECYQKRFNKSIIEDIASCGDGDLPALLKIAVICIVCPEKHFAEVVRASIVGLGTDEDSLTRAIVCRAEVDMTKIKEVYLEVNKESLEDAVVGDTSGDYKNFLLTLLGAKH